MVDSLNIFNNLGIGLFGHVGKIPAQERLVGDPPEGGIVRLVTASDGVEVRIAVWPGETPRPASPFARTARTDMRRGTVLLLHGRTEYIEKHYPVISELLDRGFAVATLDWRGQGLSERPVGHPLKGHVDDFAEYHRDLEAMLEAPEVQALPEPRLVLAHSMGGAVALRHVAKEPDRYVGAIFSAPMLGTVPTYGVDKVTQVTAQMATNAGMRREYAPGQPIEPYTEILFMSNVMTSDFDEFTRQRELIKAEPGLATAGVTWGWLRAAMTEVASLELLPPVSLKSLYFFGTEEAVVSTPAIAARVTASRNSKLAMIAGAKHESLFERPELRRRVWREIDKFLEGLGLLPTEE